MVEQFNEAADRAIGVTLGLCTVLGVLGNLVSLFYFLTAKTSTPNSTCFRRTYALNCVVGAGFCLTLIPINESAFTEDRLGLMFTTSPLFCQVWTMVNAVFLEMTVFMAAMLSTSRLILLMFCSFTFRVEISWILPLCYGILTISLKIIFTCMKVSTTFYVPQLMSCIVIAFDGTTTPESEPMVNLPNELILAITETIQSGMTVFPIFISSIMCLIYLEQSKQKTKQISGSTKKQQEAAKTVIIVTAVYVICNIPLFLYNIYFWVWNLDVDRSSSYMANSAFMASYLKYYYSPFMQNYSSILASRVFPALNATLNPLVYYFRMRSFERFLNQKGSVTKSFIRRLSQYGLAQYNGSQVTQYNTDMSMGPSIVIQSTSVI